MAAGRPPPRLLLECRPELIPEGGIAVVCSTAGLVKAPSKEAAGEEFHRLALIQRGVIDPYEGEEEESEEADVKEEVGEEDGGERAHAPDEPPAGTHWKKAKKKKRDVKKPTEVDLYALLGLQHERWMATEQQITKAYRKVALVMHPDKVATEDEATKKKLEEKFKAIQDAYETLSNAKLRREYDSMDNFDDTMPTDCDPDDFFKVFGPAFRRNCRWSVEQPVPDVGDEYSPWAEIEAFYDFWYSFKSWREFPHPDEEDISQAENREERRWIERQNSKLREKGKKEEVKRLRELVENAYRIDPRVVRHKEEVKQERKQRKREKQRAREEAEAKEREKREREEAERRAAEEEAERAAAEARRKKAAEKAAAKKQQARLRELWENFEGCDAGRFEDDDIDSLCSSLPREKLEALCDAIEAAGTDTSRRSQALQDALEVVRQEKEEAARQKEARLEATAKAMEEARQQEAAKKKQQMKEWSEEELRMLDKAVKKFPQGTRKRWEQVAAYIRTRTLEEVITMVKERKGASIRRLEGQENWKAAQRKSMRGTDGNDGPTQAYRLGAEAQAQGVTQEGPSGSTNGAEAPKTVVSATSGAWTEAQELALVKALKAIGREVEDRWDKIAEAVPGKSKAQCFTRFKELRQTFRAKKSGGEGAQ